jgi:ABC-type transport system involved in cytochrome c biogenesis permease subunit
MATTELPRYNAREEAAASPASHFSIAAAVRALLAVLSSLRLTVALLSLSLVLILAGTLAQIDRDIWYVLHDYFRVWFARIELKVFFPRTMEFPDWAAFYYPGGKLLGAALLVNLLAAHATRFRVAATGRRLFLGTALIAVGAVITYAVIASGANTAIESELPAEFTGMLWHLVRASIGAAGLALAYVLAITRRQASHSAGRWLWRLGAVTAALLVALAGYLFTHPEVALDPSGLRILWQLAKATGASIVLGLGCWAVFGKRGGIVLLHSGIALMMFSELYTASQAVEAQMSITEGETVYYAEDMRSAELAVTDVTDPKTDRVTIVPGSLLAQAHESGETIDLPESPFSIRVVGFLPNATTRLQQPGEEKTPATVGQGLIRTVDPLPQSTGIASEQQFDAPAAYVEVLAKKDGRSLGTFMLAAFLSQGDAIVDGDSTYEIALRWKRILKPYNLTLLDFKFDRYEGSTQAKNFESVVQFRDPSQNVDQQLSASMNNPIRYAGDTIYQSSYDQKTERTTFLQVVSNSGWMVPYVACMIVAAGMLVHFMQAIVRFLYRREDEARREERAVAAAVAAESRGSILSQWRRPQVWGPALVVLVLAGWVAGRAVPPQQSATEMKIHDFGALPIAYGGRILPMDSLANNALRTISGKQSFVDAQGEKQPAIRWLLDTVTRSDDFRDHRVIRIENLDVLSALGLPRREGFRYSISEIFGDGEDGKLSELDRQTRMAAEVPEDQQNLTQRKFLELQGKIRQMSALMGAFSPANIAGETPEELGRSFQALTGQIAELSRVAPKPVPPAKPAESWKLLMEADRDDLLAAVDRTGQAKPDDAAAALRAVLASYRAGDAQQFNSDVVAYRELVEQRAAAEEQYESALADEGRAGRKSAERLSTDRLEFEAYYNHFDPLFLCMILYIVAFVLAAAAWLGWFEGLNRAANWLLWFTFALHTFGLVCRIYISGRPPVTNLYSSAIFIGWAAVLFALVFEAIYHLGIGNLLAGIIGFPTMLIAHYLTLDGNGDTIGVMQAVLDTNFWLATHVVCVSLGYATTFLAGALGLLTIVMGFAGGRLSSDQRRQLTRMTYGTICFAIFFSFIGTVLGGLWADDSWGRFWGWDPKENGALMIVIWNAIVLHARWGKMIGERGLAALAVLGNIVVAWSWFGVNQMPVGLHAYGRTEGRSAWIAAFMISQLLLAALPYVMSAMRRNDRRPLASA